MQNEHRINAMDRKETRKTSVRGLCDIYINATQEKEMISR